MELNLSAVPRSSSCRAALQFRRCPKHFFFATPGLNVLIRELKNQLGFRLFDRTTRHVVLTPHGGPVARTYPTEFTGTRCRDVARLNEMQKEGVSRYRSERRPCSRPNILPQAIRSSGVNIRTGVFDCSMPTSTRFLRGLKLANST